MIKIHIDGVTYEVNKDKNLLENCLALGFDIPYFCNHPALGSVGACRLCAVKKYANADDKKGKIVMSCMEPVTEGMIISVSDPAAKKFRAAIIEGLMTNHPHDCPICDEGGECHLQDMTVMTGHNYRNFVFKKRTYISQDLGPFIQHEMNRCIQCYRCVRYYRDYCGGRDLNVFGSANHVYFGRQKDGILESEFSGNLVEVCPTGVFTDKTLKNHYSRKWDLTNAPSVCVHCSIGCNTIVSERYGMVRRIMSRYNGSVNGYFICDRGRFGYEFINSDERVKQILVRSSKATDLKEIKSLSDTEIPETFKTGKIIGIGSPRASLESNFALQVLVGRNNFYHGISGKEQKLARKAVQILESGIAQSASLKEIEKCDAILILGEDVTNTAPMLALAIRQAARNKSIAVAAKIGIPKWNDSPVREMDQNLKSPVFIASAISTKLDELAELKYNGAPQDIALFGFAIAAAINSKAPSVAQKDKKLEEKIQRIAKVLSVAEYPLIVTGTTLESEDILNAASNIALSLSSTGKKPFISVTVPECNSIGLAMMEGSSLDDCLESIEKSKPDAVLILENDLYKRASAEKVNSIFEKCKKVIVLDHLMNKTAKRADVLLPAATFAGSDGSLINNEGRAQRFYSVLPEKDPVKESWRWISDMLKISEKGKDFNWEKFDDVVASFVSYYPSLSGLKNKMPDAEFRFFNEKIARQNKRFSGRTAMEANINVSEPKPPQDNDSPLDFSMESYKGVPPSSLTPYYWSPGWNSYQAVNKYTDEPDGHLKEGGDPGFRIFDRKNDGKTEFFSTFPEPFRSDPSELLVVPVPRIFGSEELSSKGESVAKVIPESFIFLNEREISRLHLNEDEKSGCTFNKIVINARVMKDNALPDGMAGLFCPVSDTDFNELPALGKVIKV